MANKTNDSLAALYKQAKEQGVAGRSSMSKSQLRKALGESRREREPERVPSRVEAFSELAKAAANGEFVVLPRQLTGQDRRRHVRQCLREDHENRIAQNSEDAELKFDKLAKSVFKFFRGTALLFYRDMAGDDAWMPTVLTLGDVHPQNFGVMRVKDVAIRRGQGTGSLGLNRYYVLIEGPEADGSDDILLEFKQARRSALSGLVPPSPYEMDARGDRIAHAQGVQVVRGDIFYGSVQFDGLSYMSRERAPFRDDMDLDDLSKSQWRDYAGICGWTLAHVHALSDEAGDIDYDIEPAIVNAIGSPDLFLDDIVSFSEEAADRVRQDHAMFRRDHALGAFKSVAVVYR
jgi:uncharacterized protein (DUF2252 family)